VSENIFLGRSTPSLRGSSGPAQRTLLWNRRLHVQSGWISVVEAFLLFDFYDFRHPVSRMNIPITLSESRAKRLHVVLHVVFDQSWALLGQHPLRNCLHRATAK
jgi:hypothetical protein